MRTARHLSELSVFRVGQTKKKVAIGPCTTDIYIWIIHVTLQRVMIGVT